MITTYQKYDMKTIDISADLHNIFTHSYELKITF